MFLDWIAQLRLLQHDTQTNILGSLPLSIRRVLISEITTYLHPPPGKQAPDPSIFCSPAHIKWFMEVIGQGFNLPLEDMAITNDDVEIYSRWLFEPQTRPAAVMKEGLEQEFYQIIFHQFSLLFQPRIARNSIVPTQDKSHLLPPKPSSSFHINMLPVGAHSTIVPITFNPPTSSSTPTSNTNANSGTTNAASTATSGLQSNPNNSNSQATLKETLSQLVQRHIELCKKSLRVFAMAGRTLKMSTDTWSVLLKVMLGITDYLLKEPTGESSTMGVMNMGDELCDSLLQVLFELWLRSNTMDVEMWDILKSCFGRWIHRPKAIQQWSSTSLAITKRIQHLVYGDQENAEGVFVSGPNVKLDLPNEFTYYAWHRIIYLIPHPLQLPSHNFTLAMLGIGNLVDTLNSAIETTDTMASPDGNTLLNMFGTYLFDAASKSNQADTEAQRGCAESLATLCRIFCKPQRRQPFLRTYIERFYAALMTGLKSEACLPTILLSCTELFATDLEGVRMLVPDFISAIKMVLPKLTFEYKTNVSVDNLRLAAIKVLSTIMCLPNHFDKVELAKSSWDSSDVSLESVSVVGEQEQLVTQLIRVLYASPAEGNSDKPCLSLKFYILEVLLKSLRTETSSYNMRYILHLINVYVIEDVPFCPGLVGTVVKLIQEKILTMQLPADVTLVAFDVLMDFVDLYDFVKRDSKNVARELVLALSRYVDTLITAGKLAQTYPLIVQAYDCMIKWILISQWIIDDRDCYKAVIATLSKGITIFDREAANLAAPTEPVNVEKKKRRETGFPPTKQLFQLPPRVNKTSHHHTDQTQQPSSSNPNSRNSSAVRKKEEVAVRMAAEYCMSQFVNHLGQFISPDNKKILEESIDDVAQLKQLLASEEAEYSIRSFLIDKRTVLTLIDTTKTSDDNVPAITVIIRDTTGKYVWSMEARYKEHVPQNIHTASLPPSTTQQSLGDNVFLKPAEARKIQKPVTVPTATAVNEKELPSLDKVFVPESESWQQWEALKSLIDRQLMNDTRKTESKFLHEYQISPTRFNIDTDTPRGFRLFLSQIGFLLPENRHHITPLHLTDSVITEMETLDMLNERDCISISAYYAVSGNVNLEELIETPPPLSQQFLQFMNCLGWPVDIAEHKGYKGKLDATICAKMPYYSDRTVEFVVNVPYFLKSSPSSEQTLSEIYQRVSSDDHVCVVWIEDVTEYKKLAKLIKTSSATQSKTMVYIFISPLKHSADSLYWVRILVPSFDTTPQALLASQRLNENALIFGPLVDGIVVSRHALGSMVRSTSISAHQACRVVTDTYTRPYVIRREYIEEMAHRHRVKLPLSEFYTDVFTEKTN